MSRAELQAEQGRSVDAPGYPVARRVLALAAPAILQELLHTFVFLADRLMLGRYSPDALASMQVSGPTLWSLFSIGTAFAAGTIAVVGRSVGAGDAERVERAVLVALSVALLFGVCAAGLGWASRGPIVELLAGDGASAAVREAAGTYLAIVFPCLALEFVGFIATCVLQVSGDTRTPALVAAGAHGVNLVGNWVLIYGHLGAPALGVQGAALATGGAFCLQALVLVAVLLRRKHSARLVLALPGARHLRELRAVLRVSRGAFGEKLVFHAGYMVYVGIIGRLGDVAMAANQAALAIESIGFLTADGFGIAGGALVAQHLGARRAEDSARAGWTAAQLGAGSLCLGSVLFVSAPEVLVGLFVEAPNVVELGARCLLLAAVAQPAMGASTILAANLRAAGDTRTPMLVAVFGTLVVRVGVSAYLAFGLDLGLVGAWLGSTCDWYLRAVWLASVFRQRRWQTIQV